MGLVAQCAPDQGAGMSMWHWILLACAVAFATKFLGYAIPASYLQNPRMAHIAA